MHGFLIIFLFTFRVIRNTKKRQIYQIAFHSARFPKQEIYRFLFVTWKKHEMVSLLWIDRKISLHVSRSVVCEIRKIRISLWFLLNAICLTMNRFISSSFFLNALCQTKKIQIFPWFSLKSVLPNKSTQIFLCFLFARRALSNKEGGKFLFAFLLNALCQTRKTQILSFPYRQRALTPYAKQEMDGFLFAFRLVHFVEQGITDFSSLHTSRMEM